MGNAPTNELKQPPRKSIKVGKTLKFKQLASENYHDEIEFLVKGVKNPTYTKFIANSFICRRISVTFSALIDGAPTTQQKRVVVLEDFDASLFFLVLKYFYFHELAVSPGQALSLRKVAYRYKIKSILGNVDQIILHTLRIDNFCEIFAAYSQMNDLNILCTCLNNLALMQGDHVEILDSPSFLFIKLNPGLRTLILSKALKVDKSALWERCLDWQFHQQNFPCPGRNCGTSQASLRRLFECAEVSIQSMTLAHWLPPISEEPQTDQSTIVQNTLASSRPKRTPKKRVVDAEYEEHMSSSFDSQFDSQETVGKGRKNMFDVYVATNIRRPLRRTSCANNM